MYEKNLEVDQQISACNSRRSSHNYTIMQHVKSLCIVVI